MEDDLKKGEVSKKWFGSLGDNPGIEHNFYCDLEYNIYVGNIFCARYNFTILGMPEVRIGDNCVIGPNVGIYTAGHSIEPKGRNKSEYAVPIIIGSDVWSGGGCAILTSVTTPEILIEVTRL